jgi:hypothetical protein
MKGIKEIAAKRMFFPEEKKVAGNDDRDFEN